MMNSLSALESIFVAALDKNSAEDRAAYLDQACGHDPELRRHVDRLLDAQARAGGFLQQPGPGLAGTIDEQPREQPGTIIGPYKLLQQIGEGGMGVVYMAEQQEPVRRRVALKIIKPGMDSAQVVARFEAERQAIALMDHQNIARVYDAGTTETGRPYFVMELVHGVPITKYCDDNQLTPKERLELFIPVCQAVQHAHQKGVIHRDLKPSNVLVCLYDGKPVPKIIDFGVAKATSQPLTERTMFTQFGTLVGTLEYMSPEQAEMSQLGIDTRSDVYSLGVLLYELLTGATPLERKRLREAAFDEVLRIIREEEPPKPSTRLSTSGAALAGISAQRKTEPGRLTRLVRGELDWIVMKALEKDRGRRYDTASGLARDVQHYLADEAVEACPPSAGYKLRKFVRKHKAALTTVVAFAALLLAGAAASTWQAVRATRAETAALEERDRTAAEKANAQATLDFLWQDVLAQASPFNEPDRDLKVRTMLDRIADRLEKGSGKPALVEAAIRRMVGELYTDLGERSKALRHLERALDVQRRELGEEDPHTLATMHSLGVCHFKQVEVREAREVLGRTLELRRSVLGEEHPDTLVTMRYLGGCNRDQEGERLLRQALEIQSRVSGEKDRETVSTMFYLAENLSRRGKFDEAESLGAKCVDLTRRVFGDKDFLTIIALYNQARTYFYNDDHARSEPLIKEALKCVRRIADDHHPLTLGCMAGLATTYQEQGKHADAAKLIAQLLAEPRTDSDGQVRNKSHVLNLHGRALISEKKYAAAEQTLRECLAIFANSPSIAKRANFARANFLLGASLLGQKKYAEAEPFFVNTFEGVQQPSAAQPGGPLSTPLGRRYQIEAMGSLVQLYDEWDKPDEAAKWRKKLEEVRKLAASAKSK
jgi:serine/threonine protein kinase/tetratricopeptide (TPR) repeat protein